MHIEMRPLAAITPYENNPRHNAAGVDAVAKSTPVDEAWAAVPGYAGLYDVSSYGRVRRSSRSRMAAAGHVLKPRRTWDGYLKYGLSRRSRYWHVKAHRLVALAFLGPPPFPGAHVAHYDGDKANNHVSNLRWASPAENEADKRRHGRARGAPPGEAHPTSKLTNDVVRQMRTHVAMGMSLTAAARLFRVRYATARDAIIGQTWRVVADPPPVRQPRRNAS